MAEGVALFRGSKGTSIRLAATAHVSHVLSEIEGHVNLLATWAVRCGVMAHRRHINSIGGDTPRRRRHPRGSKRTPVGWLKRLAVPWPSIASRPQRQLTRQRYSPPRNRCVACAGEFCQVLRGNQTWYNRKGQSRGHVGCHRQAADADSRKRPAANNNRMQPSRNPRLVLLASRLTAG